MSMSQYHSGLIKLANMCLKKLVFVHSHGSVNEETRTIILAVSVTGCVLQPITGQR